MRANRGSLMVFALIASTVLAQAATPVAQTDLHAALDQAKKDGKLLFVVLGREACGNTRALKGYISQRTVRLSDAEFVYADLNCDDQKQNGAFRKQFSIDGRMLPFVVIADQNGKQLAGRTGFGKPQDFNSLIRTATKPSAGGAAETGKAVAKDRPNAATNPAEAARPPAAESRTWHPKNRQTFDAALVQVTGGVAVFQKADGSKFQLPLIVFDAEEQRAIHAFAAPGPPRTER